MKRWILSLAIVALIATPCSATVTAHRVTVTATAAQLDTHTLAAQITVVNQGTASVYLGGAAVLTTDGLELKPNGTFSCVLTTNEHVYAISGGSIRVDVLETGL